MKVVRFDLWNLMCFSCQEHFHGTTVRATITVCVCVHVHARMCIIVAT